MKKHLLLLIFSVLGTIAVAQSVGKAVRGMSAARLGQAEVVCDGACVWPGDANNDGRVDASDIFNIGLAFGSTGPVRVHAALAWEGQTAEGWTASFSNGLNYKYADCDGNGIIDATDTVAILANFNEYHGRPITSREAGPEIFMVPPVDTISLSTFIEIPIHLGTAALPAEDVYGVAFTIQYDPDLVDVASINFNVDSSWLGDYGTDLIYIKKNVPGYMQVGLARNNFNSKDGYGRLGGVSFITTDNLSGRLPGIDTLGFHIGNPQMIDEEGTPLAVDTRDSSIILVSAPTVPMGSLGFEIYPNPNEGKFYLKSHSIEEVVITITDIVGNEVYGGYITNDDLNPLKTIDLGNCSKGLYLVHIQSAEGYGVQKILLR
ncbi:MAG: T9SS type A sorting domain-containing protein [Chitinophagales bacterium]|nr:T9SS type A sorting domain-containing protein [Chitinophagales bacterium]